MLEILRPGASRGDGSPIHIARKRHAPGYADIVISGRDMRNLELMPAEWFDCLARVAI
jgi:hypothetical protein